MLTPRRYKRPLTPTDRRLMAALGCSREEYDWYLEECLRRAKTIAASDYPKAFVFETTFLVNFLINLAIGIALTAISYLLRPDPGGGGAPEVRTRERRGQDLIRGDRFADKSGFGSLQNVAELGSIIPMIYANRRTIGGVTYGGVRINTNLLWSQVLSLGGSQFFRGVFLVGQGGVQEIDIEQTAIGDNLLSGYGLGIGGELSTKVTLYQRLNGGRIRQSDFAGGREASEDIGNFQRRGAADVFQVPNQNNAMRPWACGAYKPSTQTQFGLYAPIGSCLSYRVNPSMEPTLEPVIEPGSNGDIYTIKCTTNVQAVVERWKYQASYHSGVYFEDQPDGTFLMSEGDIIRMRLVRLSEENNRFRLEYDRDTLDPFRQLAESTLEEDPIGIAELDDVAQAIAGRQQQYDDNIAVGDRYMIGTAIAVCIDRSRNRFESDATLSGKGDSVTATFRILQGGRASNQPYYRQEDETDPITRPINTATGEGQVFKIAIASISLGRRARVIEVGIRSTLAIRASGLMNFSTAWSQDRINWEHCEKYEFQTQDVDVPFRNIRFISGTIQTQEDRYSFWRIRYRRAGTNARYTRCNKLYGTYSNTGTAIYNYIRIAFPSTDDWEFQFEPVSGYEVRRANDPLVVLDYKLGETSTTDNGLTIYYNGQEFSFDERTFAIAAFENDITSDDAKQIAGELGIPNWPVKNGAARAYVDIYAKLAEMFIYDEISTTVENGPEHEISYVNIFQENVTAPEYDDLALLGMNLRSGPEVTQLSQLSVYVTKGLLGTNLFPEVYRDMLTNDRYQSAGVLPLDMIDNQSFDEMAQWTLNRRYFCDIAVSDEINRRSWGQETALNFLLELVTKNGKLALQPAFRFNEPEPITGLFTNDNIIEDSLELSMIESINTDPVRVSVRWRQERQSSSPSDRGVFPLTREVTVAENGTPDNAQLVRIDMSDYCTSQRHAIDVGKYRCRIPRLQRRQIKFRTWPSEGGIVPGGVFKVAVNTITYSSMMNAFVDENGSVATSFGIEDGVYTALVWRSGGTTVEEEQVTIQNGSAVGLANAIFTIASTSSDVLTFKAVRVSLSEEAEVEVEGIEFPVDDSGISLFAAGFDDDGNWDLQGVI